MDHLDIVRHRASLEKKMLLSSILSSLPHAPIYLDVGGFGGPLGNWASIHKSGKMHLIYVDPNFHADPAKEALSSDERMVSIIPFGLSNFNGQAEFHITKANGCYSCLPPDTEILSGYEFSTAFELMHTGIINVKRFDTLAKEHGIPTPHFIKIDVQGYEYQVLEGFGNALDDVVAIQLETQLKPIYKGQKLFHDIIDFLSNRGFILRDMQICGAFDYEVVELEAFFSIDKKSAVGSFKYDYLTLWEIANDIRRGVSAYLEENCGVSLRLLP